MATTSTLQAKLTTEALANAGLAWSTIEAATEVILTAISGVTLGASDAAADPGSGAAKAIAVQGVTGGKSIEVLIVEDATPLDLVEEEVDDNGAIPVGQHVVTFIFSADFEGTINGVDYAGAIDASKSYGGVPFRTLPEIPYTVAAGTARITYY